MEKLKTTNIKGKEYVQVHERIRYFNETYKDGAIQTQIEYVDNYVRVKAIVFPDVNSPQRVFIGHAEEDRTQGPVNRTNATENAETSAIGRALGFMGIGVDASIASAEEVQGALEKQNTPPVDWKKKIESVKSMEELKQVWGNMPAKTKAELADLKEQKKQEFETIIVDEAISAEEIAEAFGGTIVEESEAAKQMKAGMKK
jgi:hypothetical protein